MMQTNMYYKVCYCNLVVDMDCRSVMMLTVAAVAVQTLIE